jgi:predicted Zn-dependent protease
MLKEGFQAGRATFSREYESEADILGAVYAHRAGFSARGLANFFDRQAATNAGTQASPWLIDHPFDLDRRARVLDVAGSIEYGSAVSDPIATTALQTLNTVENQ